MLEKTKKKERVIDARNINHGRVKKDMIRTNNKQTFS